MLYLKLFEATVKNYFSSLSLVNDDHKLVKKKKEIKFYKGNNDHRVDKKYRRGTMMDLTSKEENGQQRL